uniref:Uncharacterized protein n=1 Tax=viral metagenome TaxID=1070528 RepID=A0A6C0E0P8_9ZZZZ
MSQLRKNSKKYGSIEVVGLSSLSEISISKNTATQATSITSGVTLNSPAGVVTTVSTSLSTNGTTSFVISNSYIKADSVVLSNIVNYAGSQGSPFVRVQAVTSGSFSIAIRNVDDINALNGAIKIGFAIL